MYPSKILLFGEYSILQNSQALAIPFKKFNAGWDFISNVGKEKYQEAYASDQVLKEFLSYLKQSEKIPEGDLDYDRFEKELESGIFINSNIPSGSGLGSSGAVVAAVFSRYNTLPFSSSNLDKLRLYLAEMESFFHGYSSGIDPLVSFLNKAILLKDKNSIEATDFPIDTYLQKYNLFLIDSKIKSSTRSFVEDFKLKCRKDSPYLQSLTENYIPVNNACIAKFSGSTSVKDFFLLVRKLSLLQLEFFREMIPENIQSLMKYGLEKEMFNLKLCGSGGGGYFLGFTEDVNKTACYMKEKGYNILSF
ncbi:MAG: hypothetical protein K9H12_03730 [Bacteroidales bacterium]|nr:hypothetical protein [Bacteroidales bacterium]